jgi:hypothetical protein
MAQMLLLAGRATRRGVSLWGEVTGTGADREFGVTAACKGIDADGTKGSVFSGIAGIVGESVLVPNIVSNLLASALNLIERSWTVGLSAGCVCDLLEDLGSPTGAAAVYFEQPSGFFRTQQANRVDDGIRFLGGAKQFLEGVTAGVVFSVGNNQQDLFIAIAEFHMVQ